MTNIPPAPDPHPGKTFHDPSEVVVGRSDPYFNKVVKEIIYVSDGFVVFLDTENFTYWWCHDTKYGTMPPGFGIVLNRLAELEAIPISVLSPDRQLAFRTLCAEGVSRALEEKDIKSATAVHDKAEQFVRERLKEVARTWHLVVALSALCVSGAAMAVIGLCARFGRMSWDTALILLEIIGGSLGSSFSLLTRIGSLDLDPSAGRQLHLSEAIGRIFAGAVGSYVVRLALISGHIFPGLATGASATVLLICIVSGISERLVPNVISTIEGKTKPAGEAKAKPATIALDGPAPARGNPIG